MIKVGLLTIPQKDSLLGHKYNEDTYFNPVQDTNTNWIISTQEIDYCINPDFDWVKTLPLIEWTGPYIPSISGTTGYVGS
jgi:hypothetical protein